MGKKLNVIKELTKLISKFTDITNEVWLISKKIDNKSFIAELSKLVAEYSVLNYKFSSLLIPRTLQAYSSDKDEKVFNNIIKNIKKEINDEEA